LKLKKTIRDLDDISIKTILLRTDYNVPIVNGQVKSDFRIKASLETLRYLLAANCRITIISHLGRPADKNTTLSLEPVAKTLSKLLNHKVDFLADCIGDDILDQVNAHKAGEIVMLENLRFYPQEEANDLVFAARLAQYGEVFVDDAFAVMHRKHASIVRIPTLLPALAGLLAEKEVTSLDHLLNAPTKPLVIILAGAKVSEKIEVLNNLITQANTLIIGGAMANTFLAAAGLKVGKSLYEPDQLSTAQKIKRQADKQGVKLILPQDVVVANQLGESATIKHKLATEVTAEDYIVDLGPKTMKLIIAALGGAKTIFWNGTLGITEVAKFAQSSKILAKHVADSKAQSIIGGGDTTGFLENANLLKGFSFVSTGGGATLDLLAGKNLPGWDALADK